MNFPSEWSTWAGTCGGTALVLWLHLSPGEVVRTAVLAAIGATVSFGVSLLLKGILRYRKRK